jgi:hypothetical protein
MGVASTRRTQLGLMPKEEVNQPAHHFYLIPTPWVGVHAEYSIGMLNIARGALKKQIAAHSGLIAIILHVKRAQGSLVFGKFVRSWPERMLSSTILAHPGTCSGRNTYVKCPKISPMQDVVGAETMSEQYGACSSSPFSSGKSVIL